MERASVSRARSMVRAEDHPPQSMTAHFLGHWKRYTKKGNRDVTRAVTSLLPAISYTLLRQKKSRFAPALVSRIPNKALPDAGCFFSRGRKGSGAIPSRSCRTGKETR